MIHILGIVAIILITGLSLFCDEYGIVDLLMAVLSSIFAAYIFYIIQSCIPQTKKEKKACIVLKPYLRGILNELQDFYIVVKLNMKVFSGSSENDVEDTLYYCVDDMRNFCDWKKYLLALATNIRESVEKIKGKVFFYDLNENIIDSINQIEDIINIISGISTYLEESHSNVLFTVYGIEDIDRCKLVYDKLTKYVDGKKFPSFNVIEGEELIKYKREIEMYKDKYKNLPGVLMIKGERML